MIGSLHRHFRLLRALSILSGIVVLIGVSDDDLVEARRISHRYQDQAYSLVDAVSFQLMTRYRIENAFAFDHHFRTFRRKGRAFKVVP